MKKFVAAIKDSSDFTKEIVRVASQLSRGENADLYLVYVFEIPRSLPLDEEVPEEIEKGEMILEEAVKVAEQYEISIETHLIQARAAGSGVMSEINNLKADMVVLGMKHDPVPGIIPIGGTVEYILKMAPCRIVLVRPESENLKFGEHNE